MDISAASTPRMQRVFSADDKQTQRATRLKTPLNAKKMVKKSKAKIKSPPPSNNFKKKVIKGIDNSTLDIFSANDNNKRPLRSIKAQKKRKPKKKVKKFRQNKPMPNSGKKLQI